MHKTIPMLKWPLGNGCYVELADDEAYLSSGRFDAHGLQELIEVLEEVRNQMADEVPA